ncbi:hypothetical protein KJ662_05675, partial [Patescibacteria group bacterium]|nr:hypothetical protein [Patescibacteria group bacterium]
MTNVTAANNVFEIVTATNELSGDLLFSSLFLILFIAFLIVFKKNSLKTVLVADSFFMSILAVLCYVGGLIGNQLLIAPIIIFLASILIYYFID